MRKKFADTFFELAKADSRLCAVVADISPAGSIAKFREEFPDRFVNVGVAEQVMIGMAAGMAMRGLRPFAYTIATFALYRPFEMIRDDLAYQKLPVTVVGIGGGLTYSSLGATHHAMEDIAVACAIPGLRVIAPCDPLEVEHATKFCAENNDGPIYMRLGKAGEPTLTKDAEPWQFGKTRYLQRGRDLCILCYGPIMKMAKQVAEVLEAKGWSVSLISVHTLKPLDRTGIMQALDDHAETVVLEEMLAQGGLGTWVRAIAQEHGSNKRLQTFGLRNEFTHIYGSHDELLANHGLTVENIVGRVL